jgi:hypothetical protein
MAVKRADSGRADGPSFLFYLIFAADEDVACTIV